MISRSFHPNGVPVAPQRYGCGMKKPEQNYDEDYCCIGITREKHCKTYYEGQLSNYQKFYDGVDTEIICNSDQDTETTTDVTTTAKTTGTTTEETTTISQNMTDSSLLQSAFILGLLILIST